MPAPDTLLQIGQNALVHPSVAKTGITKTEDGGYALLATVRKGTPTPIAEIENLAGNFPVVYQEEEDLPPVAWPARPASD